MTVSPLISLTLRIIAVLATFLVMPAFVLAQDDGPGYVDFRIVTVADGQNSEWISLMRERREVMQEQGQAFFHVYQRLRGPLGVYLIIIPHIPVGTPASELAETNWLNLFEYTVASQSLVTVQNYPDATTNDSGSAHPGGPYMFSRLRTVAAGRDDDYQEWLTDELIPALRDAGVDDARTLRAVVGGSPRTWILLTFMDNWPGENLGLDRRMLDRGIAMVVSQTNYLYAFREDLSYTAN